MLILCSAGVIARAAVLESAVRDLVFVIAIVVALALTRAIVQAVTHYNNPKILAQVSTNIGEAMVGINDVEGDAVNFRDREGGNKSNHAKLGNGKQVKLNGETETQLYGSSWEVTKNGQSGH